MISLPEIFKKINKFFSGIAILSIALMIISTTLDTTLRFSINKPIAGVFELNEILLVVTVFLGITWTQIERGHTRVIILLRKFPIRQAIKIDILCWILCFIFLFIMGLQSGKEALRSFQLNEFRWGSVQMPIWWAKALIPLGCWMTCLQLIIDIAINIGRLKGYLPLELPELKKIGD